MRVAFLFLPSAVALLKRQNQLEEEVSPNDEAYSTWLSETGGFGIP